MLRCLSIISFVSFSYLSVVPTSYQKALEMYAAIFSPRCMSCGMRSAMMSFASGFSVMRCASRVRMPMVTLMGMLGFSRMAVTLPSFISTTPTGSW